MMRSRRKIVPFSQVSQQRLPGSPRIIHVPATVSDYEDEPEPESDVVYVRATPVKSRTRVVHVISSATNSPRERSAESPSPVGFVNETRHQPPYGMEVENERIFITTPLTKIENERVFIHSPVRSTTESERVFVTTPDPKVVLERVYIAQPQTPVLPLTSSSTPPSDFAGAAKDDALTTSGKAAINADGSPSMSMNDNNITSDFQ